MGRGARLKIQVSDVETVFGIPDSGVDILGSRLDKSAICKAAIRNLIGCASHEEDACFACERLLQRAHGLKDAQFITAFMIYVMGVLCRSKKTEMFKVDNFWPALKNVTEIGKFNWGEYVLQKVLLACLDANSASRNNAVPSLPPGCLLFLQVRGVTYFFRFLFCDFRNKP
jgi:hypothetical protein